MYQTTHRVFMACFVCALPPLLGAARAAADEDTPARQTVAAPQEEAQPVKEVVVTGSRIPRPNLESNSALTTLDAERFLVDAETNVVRQLQNLPAFSPTRSPSLGEISSFPGSYVDLRGLGRDRTLVLVNGRRWINTISDGGVDVSTIPPELIERVDVVTGGAAATYGSDAVAGVINFIFKDHFDGLEFNLQSGMTERGESTNTRLSLTGGGKFADGAGSAWFNVAWDQTEKILADNRSAFNPAVQNVGGRFVPIEDPVVRTGSALVDLGNGPELAAFLPNGELFTAPGQVNALTDFANPGKYANLQHPADKFSFAAGLTQRISERVEFYADGIFVRDQINVIRAPNRQQEISTPIGLDNPYLAPLTRAYLSTLDTDNDGFVVIPGFSRLLEELGPVTTDSMRNSFHVGSGLRIDLGARWDLEVFATYSESTGNLRTRGNPHLARLAQALDVVDLGNGPQCRDPFYGSAQCVPINLFGVGSITPEAAAFIDAESAVVTRNADIDTQAVVTGKLWTLPAGALGFAGGIEWRESSAGEHPSEVARFGLTGGGLGDFSASLRQSEIFSEFNIPLLTNASFAKSLDLELGARYSQFDPGDNAWTYKAIGNWSPVEHLKFRGGVQRATRAPTAFQLGGKDQFFFPVAFIGGDPCATGAPLTGDLRTSCIANGVPVSVADTGFTASPFQQALVSTPGNPNLSPEKADTYTVGAVLENPGIERLTLTVDYYNIEVKGTIGLVPPVSILPGCFLSGTGGTHHFCEFFGRNSATGQLETITFGPENIGSVTIEGIDFGANYSMPAPSFLGGKGNFAIAFLGSYLLTSERTPFVDEPQTVIKCAGRYAGICDGEPLPQWKSSTQFAWDQGPLRLALNWRWVGSVDNSQPDTPGLVKTRIGDQHYFDLTGTYRLGERLEFRGGITNLTDVDPPIVGADVVAAPNQRNTYQGLYDSIGRRYFLGVRLRL